MLDGHAVRSYVFATLLAARDGIGSDQELLYVGCVLHDIGLTPRFADPVRAFEHVSADTCAQLVERPGAGAAPPLPAAPGRGPAHGLALSPAEENEVLLAGGRRSLRRRRRPQPRGQRPSDRRAGFKHEFTQLLRSEVAASRFATRPCSCTGSSSGSPPRRSASEAVLAHHTMGRPRGGVPCPPRCPCRGGDRGPAHRRFLLACGAALPIRRAAGPARAVDTTQGRRRDRRLRRSAQRHQHRRLPALPMAAGDRQTGSGRSQV